MPMVCLQSALYVFFCLAHIMFKVNTCAGVTANAWPNGEYLLANENAVGLTYCHDGASSTLPFPQLGTPLMFLTFQG